MDVLICFYGCPYLFCFYLFLWMSLFVFICFYLFSGKGVVECAVKNGNIVLEPLAYMRGKTFNKTFVVLDEAQNCKHEEIKMFMTRIGIG